MARDPYRYFRIEGRELVDQLSKGALDLEKAGATPEIVSRLLRLAHTLKGAARVVKQIEIADHAHAIEGTLGPYRDAAGELPREQIESMLQRLDDIGARVQALALPATPESPAAAPVAGDEEVKTVRAEIAEMDALLDKVTETHAQLGVFRKAAGTLARAVRLADLLAEQTAAPGFREEGRPSFGGQAGPSKVNGLAEELRDIVSVLNRDLNAGVHDIDRELGQVRDAAEQLRLVPAASLFTALERTARDAVKALGKQATFDARGGDIRIDSHVLGTIQGALVQIVRNAAAHGIESEVERRRAGKPASGRISLDITRRGRRVLFCCRDDGRGVDLEAVRQVALRRGVAPDTESATADQLMQVLLQGGISTSATVTEVAGRGIGLDVVRDAVRRLGGEVSVRSQPGQGTSFELLVPVSLASLEALVVEAGGVTATIPLDCVRHTVRVAPRQLARTAQGEAVEHAGVVIPFTTLTAALHGRTGPRTDRAWSTVIVQGSDGLAAIGVDRLLGTATIVVRPVPELAFADPVVAGASIDTDGSPRLVLDPDGLVTEARRQGLPEVEAAARSLPVLVVDDSLTTRMLEQSILESAGYQVDTATSGLEALDCARRKTYALFLVDVEMPGMDGFTFIERIRVDPVLRDIPAILVTSRASPEDRERGRLAGAQGHIVKSEFDQSDLLLRIQRLVG